MCQNINRQQYHPEAFPPIPIIFQNKFQKKNLLFFKSCNKSPTQKSAGINDDDNAQKLQEAKKEVGMAVRRS